VLQLGGWCKGGSKREKMGKSGEENVEGEGLFTTQGEKPNPRLFGNTGKLRGKPRFSRIVTGLLRNE